jgi:DNA-binding transcriptional ArsR family regulator
MPIRPDTAFPAIRVAESALFELMWVKQHAEFTNKIEGRHDELEPVRLRYGPELAQFKIEGLPHGSVDVVVLGERCSTLLGGDLHRFFADVDGAITERKTLPSLRSETPDEIAGTARLLDWLRTDSNERARYIGLLRDMWADVEPGWREWGRPAVHAKVQRWTRALMDGVAYRQLLGVQQLWPSRPELDDIADEAAAMGRLVLTPTWFGGQIHILELDGLIYIGCGLRLGEPSYRDVAAAIASNIKALADPTRLAILIRLAQEPASVTDVARQFELSQPAVSGHVQILREAGLLDEKKVGRSAILSANEDRVLRLLSEAGTSLQRAFRP